MRLALLIPLLAACSSPDLLVGTYTTTISGSDMSGGNTTNVSGSATIAITHALAMTQPQPYAITVAETDLTACTLNGTQDPMSPLKISIASGQNCTLLSPSGSATATFTSGSIVLTSGAAEKDDSMTLNLAYTFTGTTIFNIQFNGSGARTYTGGRR